MMKLFGRSDAGADRVRGAAFRELVCWHAAEHGADQLTERVVGIAARFEHAGLKPEAKGLGILASSWYEAPLVHALLDAMVEGLTPADQRAMAAEAASHVMTATLSGVYRMLFEWMATPGRYARFAGLLWRSYFDGGDFLVELEAGTRTALCTISDWTSHHPFMCELNLWAATEIYRAMGCLEVVTVRRACVSDGERHCSFVTTWTHG